MGRVGYADAGYQFGHKGSKGVFDSAFLGGNFSRRICANARQDCKNPTGDKPPSDRLWFSVASWIAAMPGRRRGNAGIIMLNRVTSDRGAELIERARALVPLIAGAAGEIERTREIPKPVLE